MIFPPQNQGTRPPQYGAPQTCAYQQPQINPMPLGSNSQYQQQYQPGFPTLMPGIQTNAQVIPRPPMYQTPQYPTSHVILTRPPPTQEKYSWNPHTDPMKWPLAESIDVEQIVRKGDLQSVEFYLKQFAFANITNEDREKFGTKAAMNAFLILQLGADYLLHECNSSPQPSTKEADENLVKQYKDNISKAEASLRKHKEAIQKLQENVAALKEERRKNREIIKKLNAKVKSQKAEKKVPNRTDTEPGALHDQTVYNEIKKADKLLKKENIHSDSESDGEIHSYDETRVSTSTQETSDDYDYYSDNDDDYDTNYSGYDASESYDGMVTNTSGTVSDYDESDYDSI